MGSETGKGCDEVGEVTGRNEWYLQHAAKIFLPPSLQKQRGRATCQHRTNTLRKYLLFILGTCAYHFDGSLPLVDSTYKCQFPYTNIHIHIYRGRVERYMVYTN